MRKKLASKKIAAHKDQPAPCVQVIRDPPEGSRETESTKIQLAMREALTGKKKAAHKGIEVNRDPPEGSRDTESATKIQLTMRKTLARKEKASTKNQKSTSQQSIQDFW
ncbi:expressed unknown protein [Seminavis robusta]|uniref:Uncharacterized protein n=1 Tax=Seminavis robusta TaxID=568900 RepID=A0A9N8D7X5_9STRA|nr:expressed unknown protein [Seminavis robusta]|eukprot:Sro25_g016821.1  (109) ;mRNA; r:47278-47727